MKNALIPTGLSLPDYLEESEKLHPDVSINEALLASIDHNRLEEQKMEVELYDKLHSCEPLPDIEEFLATKDTFIKRQLLRKMKLDVPESSAKPVYEKRYISVDQVLLIKYYQSGVIPIDIIIKKYPWIKWNYNKQEPAKSTISCGLCGENHDKFKIIDTNNFFVNGDGVLKATEAENLVLIRNHERTPHHNLVVAKLQDMTIEELLMNDESDYELDNHDKMYEITIKMFRLVYLGLSYVYGIPILLNVEWTWCF